MGMLLSGPVESFATPAGCFASSNAGIVTIGNRRFSRSWRITERGLLPVSILLDGQELLAVRNETVQEEIRSRFQVYGAPLTQTGAPALHALLELELPTGGMHYHFAVSSEVSAVVVERIAPESSGDFPNKPEAADPTGLEVDPDVAQAVRDRGFSCCESFRAASAHLKLREFVFADQTDRHDNLLRINEYRLATVEKIALRGTLFAVEDPLSGRGIILLKFAPLPERRPLTDPIDFEWDAETFALHGDRYPWAVIGFDGGWMGLTRALHLFQRELRCVVPGRDGLALSNTWGDRNRDQALNESFMLEEIDIASSLGIDVCQIDDGWQRGVTVNSVKARESGGVWEGYYAANAGFWEVHPGRFPNGLSPLVARAAEKQVGLGLWFSPDSSNDFANWRRDVDTVCRLQREFGVNWIKVDGVKSRTRAGEANLRCFFHEALERTGGKLTFDLDVTAEIRPGYFGMPEFGTLFVENRYSDWRRWWPYATFRNLWELSRAVPPVRLRFECLNPERNQDKYGNDPLAPYHYRMDWIFASIMVSSPLLWCELSGLSAKCRAELKEILALWRNFRDELHAGVAWPVGPCPDGTTTSGFFTATTDQSICHLILLRDLDREETREIDLPVKLTEYAIATIAGEGRFELAGKRGIRCTLPAERSYLWLRFSR